MEINTKELARPALIVVIILALFIVGGDYLGQNPENEQGVEDGFIDNNVNSDNISGPEISGGEVIDSDNVSGSETLSIEPSPAVVSSEPAGKVIYWMNIISNKKNYKFDHYCDGTVKMYKNDANYSDLIPKDSTAYYCIGRNQLFLNLDGTLSLIKDETVTDAKDAPLLTDIKRVSSDKVLISYSANSCITVNDCSAGTSSDYTAIEFNLNDNTFRDVKK